MNLQKTVKENSIIRLNGKTFQSYEEFRNYMLSPPPTKQEAINDLKRILNTYEEKYNISTEAFAKKVIGTPAEDEPDFLNWAIHYDCYSKIVNGKK